MGKLFSPRCFLSLSFFLLTILTIYGIVGAVLNIFESSKIHNLGEWPFNLHPLYYAFIGIQGLFPVAGFFAILSTCKNQPMFLYGSGSVLLGIFTCASVFGIVSYRPTTKDISDAFYATLKKNVNNSHTLNWMNDIQWKHKCCGVYSYADWSMDLNDAESLLDPKSVPWSCCRREDAVPSKSCGMGMLSPEYNLTQANQLIYVEGCEKTICQATMETLHRVGLEICVIGGVALLVAIFLYVGISKIYLDPLHVFSRNSGNSNNDDEISSNGVSQSPTTTTMKVHRMNNRKKAWSGSTIDSANNNNVSTPGNVFGRRENVGQRKRRQKAKQNKFNFSNASSRLGVVPQSKTSKILNSISCKDANASKSFILGEALAADEIDNSEILRNNVDMLWYESLDKNVSNLSTTPNDISSINFPSNFQNKKQFFSSELVNAINDERNTVLTLVSERPFTPSLSQNCSISFFNNYPKVSNGTGNNGIEATTPGQSSPHFASSKQQRSFQPQCTHLREDELISALLVAEEHHHTEQEHSDAATAPIQNVPSLILLKLEESENNDKKNDNEASISHGHEQANSVNDSLIPQMNAAATSIQSGPPTQPNATGKYPTSSVRSSTLATIHEESESTKGTPATTKNVSPVSSVASAENVSPEHTQIKPLHNRSGNSNSHTENDQVGVTQCSSNQSISATNDSGDKTAILDETIKLSEAEIIAMKNDNNTSTLSMRAIRVGPQEYKDENERDTEGENLKRHHSNQSIHFDSNRNTESIETLPDSDGRINSY